MKRILIILFFSILGSFIFCQEADTLPPESDEILFVIRDSKESYLETHIVQYIKEISKEKGLYKEVLTSSDLPEFDSANFEIKKSFSKNSNAWDKAVVFDESYQENIDQFAEQIKKVTDVLVFRVSKINELLEYQFIVFKTAKGSQETGNTIPSIEVNEDKSANFLVDPNSQHYKEILNYELRKIFSESNMPPEAIIRVNGFLAQGDMNYFAKSEEFVLDGVSSFDLETPPGLLKYTWKTDSKKIPFIQGFNLSAPSQKIAIEKTGTYIFTLSVFDGISYSKDTSVTIEIIERPELSVENMEYRNIHQSTLIGLRKSRVLINNEASISFIADMLDRIVLEYNRDEGKAFVNKSLIHDESAVDTLIITPKGSTSQCPGCQSDKNWARNLEKTKSKSVELVRYTPSLCNQNGNLSLSGEGMLGLNFASLPGRYPYSFYGEKNGVKSRIDTLVFDQRLYRPFYILFGYRAFRITTDSDFLNANIQHSLELGLRLYLYNRLSTDLNFLIPVKEKNASNDIDESIVPNNFKIDLNYDVFRKYGVFYGTAVASYYQFVFPDDNDKPGVRQFGIGANLRFEILNSKPKWGLFLFEAEFAYYNSLSNADYHSIGYNFSLVYGFYYK